MFRSIHSRASRSSFSICSRSKKSPQLSLFTDALFQRASNFRLVHGANNGGSDTKRPHDFMGKPVNNPKENHSFTFHPKVFQWLRDLANRDYEGNISAAVTALIIYDRGVTQAKKLASEPYGHFLTKGVPQDPDRLDAVIREIEGIDPGFSARTWLELEKGRAQSPHPLVEGIRSDPEPRSPCPPATPLPCRAKRPPKP